MIAVPSNAVGRSCRVALALAVMIVACDKSPIAPNENSAYPVRVELSGPDSVPPDGTAQFTVRGFWADGSQDDLTNQASWRSGNTSILIISASGVATGRALGETSISVSFKGRSATKTDVVVVPAGTYRVSGVVRDAGAPVLDAEVVVTSGPAQGLRTTAAGNYKLYGVVGDSEIRVSKPGYEEARQRVNVTGHRALDFHLTLTNARDEVAGTYTLTVTAADSCATALPPEARSRTYTAVITQNGPYLGVKLGGASFYRDRLNLYDHFVGIVEAGRVTFQLYEGSDYYGFFYEFPDVVEQLTQNLFSFGGFAATTASAGGRLGTLTGALVVVDGNSRSVARCQSSAHRFELTR